jgi:peptide/nickel transport system ATP-binding protein
MSALPSNNNAVLRVEQLSVQLPAGADRPFAISDISFSIEPGKTLCVVGESGSGKSVMAFAVMGLLARELKVAQGQILLADSTTENGSDSGSTNQHAGSATLSISKISYTDVTKVTEQRLRQLRGSQMGMVFQEPMTALNPVMSCGKQVDELLREHTQLNAEQRKQSILQVFAKVKLPEPERMFSSYPHQLSGGQRQRIVIAMAVILKPRLLICDEPTTALDVTTQKEILKLINELQAEQGSAVLFITHDMGVVADIADDVLVMNQGKMVEMGSCASILKSPQQPYTQMLLAAVPSMKPPPPRNIVSTNPLLQGKAVDKTYITRNWFGGKSETRALQDATLALHAGETVGIVGESGSGKSTFARCLIRLIDPTAGEIYWAADEVAQRSEGALRPLRSHIQVVFQDPNRSLNPRMKIGDAIIEGALNFGMEKSAARELAKQLMQKVQLPVEGLERYSNQFSGGQRQRLAIARALACKPKVLVADEAVSALDVSVQAQILNLLRDIQREFNIGLLFITHDLRVAAQLCDRILVMHQGKIVEQGLTASVYANPQQQYTKDLLDAAPGTSAIV